MRFKTISRTTFGDPRPTGSGERLCGAQKSHEDRTKKRVVRNDEVPRERKGREWFAVANEFETVPSAAAETRTCSGLSQQILVDGRGVGL